MMSICQSFFDIVRRTTRCVVVLVSAVGLVACGLTLDSQERLERAQVAYQSGKYQEASLDVKRVLQDEPDNIGARVLLGRVFLRQGDSLSAEAELRRALSLGVDRGAITVDLGQALAGQGEFETLLAEISAELVEAASEKVEIYALRGDASRAVRTPAEARSEYAKAIALDPNYAVAKLGVVSSYMSESRSDQARIALDKLLKEHPDFAAGFNASGTLFMVAENPAAAVGAFDKAQALAATQGKRRQQLTALSGIVESYLAQEKLDKAQEYVEQYRSVAPNDMAGTMLVAKIAIRKGEWSAASDALDVALKNAPGYPPANFLMGVVQSQLGSLERAQVYLNTAISGDPSNSSSRQLLAKVRADLNQTDDAIAALQPLIDAGDARSLGIAARVRLDAGEFDSAVELLRQKAAGEPDNAGAQLDLAVGLLAANRVAEAQEVMSAIPEDSAAEQDSVRREFVSILTLLGDKKNDEALRRAQAASERWPTNARLHSFIGRIHAAEGNLDAARERFASAIEVDPNEVSSYIHLASLDAVEGDYDAASSRYLIALERNPGDVTVLVALAGVENLRGDVPAATKWLELAIKENPKSTMAYLHLAHLQLRDENYPQAQINATKALRLDASSAEAHNILGLALRESARPQDAIDSFEKAVALDEDQALYHTNYAREYIQMGNHEKALEITQRAFDMGVYDERLGILLVVLQVEKMQFERALSVADALEGRGSSEVVVQTLRGDILSNAKRHKEAATAYAAALAIKDDLRLARRVFSSRLAAGMPNALRVLEDFSQRHPEDVQARLSLAQSFQQTGDNAKALGEYEKLAEQQPENPIVLNNMAWIYHLNGDMRALPTAQRAAKVAPDSGSVIDTLGWVQLHQGQVSLAVETLRSAATMAPKNPAIQYHLAVALTRDNRGDEAKLILADLVKGDAVFDDREAAETLYATL